MAAQRRGGRLRGGRPGLSQGGAGSHGSGRAPGPRARHSGSRRFRPPQRQARGGGGAFPPARLCLHGRNLEKRRSGRDAHDKEGGTPDFFGSNAGPAFTSPACGGPVRRSSQSEGGWGATAGYRQQPCPRRAARQRQPSRPWPLCQSPPRGPRPHQTPRPRRADARREHAQGAQGFGSAQEASASGSANLSSAPRAIGAVQRTAAMASGV